jgi:hypothetical protein
VESYAAISYLQGTSAFYNFCRLFLQTQNNQQVRPGVDRFFRNIVSLDESACVIRVPDTNTNCIKDMYKEDIKAKEVANARRSPSPKPNKVAVCRLLSRHDSRRWPDPRL